MLILAIDTSWKHGGLALARGDAHTFELLETAPLEGGTFSAQLVPQAARLLAKRNLTKADLEGFAAASGPGSFTGLRVGLSAIKALAEVLQKPIATVSVLEALAISCGLPGRVRAVLDAGRGELYVGEYEANVETLHATSQREVLMTPEEFRLGLSPGDPVVTPEQSVAEMLKGSGFRVLKVDRPGAELIARIGIRKILAGQTVSPEALDANYIRRSDAEIFSLPKIRG
jgi:tRNA threonylcarbamoyladenosine biosynthesis protein TsaB